MNDRVLETGNSNNVYFNRGKAKKALADPALPGERCAAEPRKYYPVVNRGRCEAKRDCIEVCPYGVFTVLKIKDEDFANLSFLGKLKSRVHGGQTAYTPNADRCQACRLCVVSCPEDAIELMGT